MTNVFSGCQVEIWRDTDARGDHFTCPGYDYGNWCGSNSLGTVGNDQASTITCTCNLNPIQPNQIPGNLVCPASSVDGSNRKKRLTEQERVVGGHDARLHSWPWIAKLSIGPYRCGGTILGKFLSI